MALTTSDELMAMLLGAMVEMISETDGSRVETKTGVEVEGRGTQKKLRRNSFWNRDGMARRDFASPKFAIRLREPVK